MVKTEIYRMFTGIIEDTGLIKAVERKGSNVTLEIRSALAAQLKIDQSLGHDGVCLRWKQPTPKPPA